MTKASDNVFTKLIGAEAAAPGTPASGTAIAYVKTDGLWYSKDDAGVETLMSSAAGMTNPLTTTGDMIYSSSGTTPARLAAVATGKVLKSAGTSTAPAWGYLPYIGFRAYAASAQALSAATETTVTFGTEEYDTDACFASPTFTVPAGMGGKWRVKFHLYFAGNPGSSYARLYLNSTTYTNGTGVTLNVAVSTSGETEGTLVLAAADTLVVRAYITNAGDIGAGTGYQANTFEAQFMGV